MCGICGILSADPSRPCDPEIVERMREAMVHRGPDEGRTFIDGSVALASRRLSIIDLAAGQQPMPNEDRSIWLVFNGEIYNSVELRTACLRRGHTVRTRSDTEVILHLYEDFGRDCVHHLNGMFAFAIWDSRTATALLARDRLGIKPLYYTTTPSSLLFASEIKSLLAHPEVIARVDASAIDEFMTYGFVQTPRTMFSNISRLPEGHTLTWSRDGWTVDRYWDLSFTPDVSRSERRTAQELRELLADAVRLQLRSDVPLGVLLSGGVDSTTIAALSVSLGHRPKTFSIGFEADHQHNDLPYARSVAKSLHTEHFEITLGTAALCDFIPRLTYYMEEPVADSAAVPLYFVSELAASHVRVVLSGEGADELFGGYSIYHYMRVLDRYAQLPLRLRQIIEPLLGMVHSRKLDKYVYLSHLPVEQRFLNTPLHDRRVQRALYTPEFDEIARGGDVLSAIKQLYAQGAEWDLLSRLLYVDAKTWLPNSLLAKADRMSMANSLEARVPFLDHRVVEYAATIPSRYKLRWGRTKKILRDAMRGAVPPRTLTRRKMGFPTPVSAMFRGALGNLAADVLSDSTTRSRGYFDSAIVDRLLKEHRSGVAEHHETLWRLLVLEDWHRAFVDTAGRHTVHGVARREPPPMARAAAVRHYPSPVQFTN
jgi:asparagine synthase (glutamine-hydrolysing)